MAWETLVQQLLNALSLGTIYALLALGLAVIYSVLRMLNFAYGELVAIVGYTIYLLGTTQIGFWLAGALGVLAAIALAIVTELIIFRPLRHAPPYAVIFASFALSIAIQAIFRNFISSRTEVLRVPDWLNGVIDVGGLQLPILSLISVAVGAVAFFGLNLLLMRSRYGLAIRAASESFATTRLMGARAGQMFLLAFVVSGLLAGIAGFLYAARTGAVSPSMGFNPLLQSFIAVVIGGVGSFTGAIYGGFALALLEVGLRVFLPDDLAGFALAFALLIVVVVLYFRPDGFARRAEGRVG
jgi:branched-chain amino acid transport system permease protein